MKYTILIYESESDFSARTDETRKAAYCGDSRAYTQALKDAGIMVGGAPLQPGHLATTIRQHNGKRHVQDGPYAEAKEQLGGYFFFLMPPPPTELYSLPLRPAFPT